MAHFHPGLCLGDWDLGFTASLRGQNPEMIRTYLVLGVTPGITSRGEVGRGFSVVHGSWPQDSLSS